MKAKNSNVSLARKFDALLDAWKANPRHLPLIVKGARQVGKTYSIRQFARRSYRHFVEINFVERPEFKVIVRDGFSVAAIVRNKAKSALRRNRLEEPLEDDLLQISIPNEPEQKILLSELREIAHKAVDSLGEPDREIFQRYYFLYQKTEDIATALGLKDATVRTKLARGRKRLRDYLTERGFHCEDTHY